MRSALLAALLLLPSVTFAQRTPWRAHEALGVRWLRFGLEHRSRFEHLANDFRVSNPGDATAYSMRTLLNADARFSLIALGAELQDSQVWASSSTPLNNTLSNPVELLQAYLGFRVENFTAQRHSLSLTAGRITMDLGSRRVLGRNEFRNTINAFTGLDALWTIPQKLSLRLFFAMPVMRLPSAQAALQNHSIEFDVENTDALFWGLFFEYRALPSQLLIETYVLGLHERDSDRFPSANRSLVTPGLRLHRAPASGRFDFQIELLGQFGTSHASNANTDTRDLVHLAGSAHASLGYRFAVWWAPRLAFLYDYASGDRSSSDGFNNRFDALFGVRRMDYGPTGVYGAFGRSNTSVLQLRFEVQPHRMFDAFAAYRLGWLASVNDAWVAAGLRSSSATADPFVGQQFEARARWHVLPGNLSLDVGGVFLLRGTFARGEPGGEEQPSSYVYAQLTGTI